MPDGQPPAYDPNTRRAPLTPVTPHAGTYGAPAESGSGGGPGFKYDRATLEQLAKDWNDMANEFQDDQARARYLAQTEGPGLEYASGGNAEQIRKSGQALLATLTEREQYCRAMANKFRSALGKYASADDTHSAEIKQTGGSL
jgi:hypothetical protein